MGKPRSKKSAPTKQSPPPPPKGRRTGPDPRQQTLIPANRTLFYGCNGIVAAVQEVHSGRQSAQTWGFADAQQLASARKEDGHETV